MTATALIPPGARYAATPGAYELTLSRAVRKPPRLRAVHADGSGCPHGFSGSFLGVAGITESCPGLLAWVASCAGCGTRYLGDDRDVAAAWMDGHTADHRAGRTLVLDHAVQVQNLAGAAGYRPAYQAACVCTWRTPALHERRIDASWQGTLHLRPLRGLGLALALDAPVAELW